MSAATAYWRTEKLSGNWSDPSNWGTLSVPGAGDDIVFSNGTADCTVTLDVNATVGKIILLSAGTSRNLTFTGPGVLTITNGIEKFRTTRFIVNNDIVLGGNITISNQAAAGGTREIALNGVISDGGNNYGITKSGTLQLMLTNNPSVANTFGGPLVVNQGDLWASVPRMGTANQVRFEGVNGTLLVRMTDDTVLTKDLVVNCLGTLHTAPGIGLNCSVANKKLILTGNIHFQQAGDFAFYTEGGMAGNFVVLSNTLSGTLGKLIVAGKTMVPVANNASSGLGVGTVILAANASGGGANNANGQIYLNGPLTFNNDILITNSIRGGASAWHRRIGAINAAGTTSDFTGTIYFYNSEAADGMIAFCESAGAVVRFTGTITNGLAAARGILIEGQSMGGKVQLAGNNAYNGITRGTAGYNEDVGYGPVFTGIFEARTNTWAGLSGAGTITVNNPAGVVIQQTCQLDPGNSIGTLTVAGNMTLQNYAQLRCEIGTGGTSDTVVVTGALTLENPVKVILLKRGDVQPGDEFTILQFGSLVGSAANLVAEPGVFTGAVFYQDGNAIKVSNLVYTAPTTLFSDEFTGTDGTWLTAGYWTIRNSSGGDALDPDHALVQNMYGVGLSNQYVLDNNQLKMRAGTYTNQGAAIGGLWYASRWVLQPMANGAPVHVNPVTAPLGKIYISLELGEASVIKSMAGTLTWNQNQYLQIQATDSQSMGDVGVKRNSGYFVRMLLNNSSNLVVDCIARDNTRATATSANTVVFGGTNLPYADVVGQTVQMVLESNTTCSVYLGNALIGQGVNMIPGTVAEDLVVSLFHMAQVASDGDWKIDTFEIKPVPEPGLLAVLGVVGVWAARRRG